jgi:hypothetical protein
MATATKDRWCSGVAKVVGSQLPVIGSPFPECLTTDN